MRKTFNVGGKAAFLIKIDHCVTANHFAYALAHNCWNNNIEFDKNIKRSEALKILKESLYHYGLNGETDFTYYESADAEATRGFDKAYPLAKEWVLKNYPYLNGEKIKGKKK